MSANSVKFCEKEYIARKKKSYALGNKNAICDIAGCYAFYPLLGQDFIKAYSLYMQTIQENPSKTLLSCYSGLAEMYENGYGVAEDILEAIRLHKLSFKNNNYRTDLTPRRIANLYLEKLQDYKNAKKWYKVAYSLSKNIEFLLNLIVDDKWKK